MIIQYFDEHSDQIIETFNKYTDPKQAIQKLGDTLLGLIFKSEKETPQKNTRPPTPLRRKIKSK